MDIERLKNNPPQPHEPWMDDVFIEFALAPRDRLIEMVLKLHDGRISLPVGDEAEARRHAEQLVDQCLAGRDAGRPAI